MRSLFAITVLFIAALGNAVSSPNLFADTLAPRQQPGTLTYIPGAPPFTFNYTCTTPSADNSIAVWSAVDPKCTTLAALATAWVSDSAGTALVPIPDSLPGGQYLAQLLSPQENVIAAPVIFDFGKCVRPGSSVCLDGTVCSGAAAQCTVDARNPNTTICCAAGQKAFYGNCYDAPNGDDIDVCLYSQYEDERWTGQVCDLTQNNYCACLGGQSWSACKCCGATQYLSGSTGNCVNKS
ncbi:hypothetical protein MY10362_007345 [Beauveria mimosiformis]